MKKKKRKPSKLLNLFLASGSICFISVAIYMIVLMWKSYVWANWLFRLQDTLNRYESGAGPLI